MTDIKTNGSRGPVPSATMVTADQATIVGNGTSSDPLRAGPSGGGGKVVARKGGSGDYLPGCPVCFARNTPPDEPLPFALLSNSGFGFLQSLVSGVITSVGEDDTIEVQLSGIVELPTEAWDAVTGETGGLDGGVPYYPGEDLEDPGKMTSSVTTPGAWVAQVGVALSSTRLIVNPERPVQNLAGYLLNNGEPVEYRGPGGQDPPPPTIGMFVSFVDGQLALAEGLVTGSYNGNKQVATAVGVIVFVLPFPNDDLVIVQESGTVTLTTSQWDAVTGLSGGLGISQAWYVSDDTIAPGIGAGHITGTKPGVGIARVGMGMSNTKMQLSLPAILASDV